MSIINRIINNFETEYLSPVADLLQVPEDYDIVLSVWKDPPIESDRSKVVILTSHEEHDIPHAWADRPDVKLIFTQYLGPEHPKMFGLPLGCAKGFQVSKKPIQERKYLFSFIGCLNDSGRKDLWRAISKLPENIKNQGFFHAYEGWNNGLGVEKYSEVMSETQIALCPPGYISDQSFRYFEALAAECYPVAPFYHNHSLHTRCPWYDYVGLRVQQHNWGNLAEILTNAKNQINQNDVWQEHNRKLYSDYIAPKGLVKNYMQPIIDKCL